MMATMTRCRACGTAMIDNTSYCGNPALRRLYARASARWGMCYPCVRRARKHGTLPDPAPLKPRADTPCRDCGHAMVSQDAYRADPQLRHQYRAHQAFRLCKSCYSLARLHGTLPDPAPQHVRRRPRRADTFRDRPGPNDQSTVERLRASVGFAPPPNAAPARPGAAPRERHAKGEVTV